MDDPLIVRVRDGLGGGDHLRQQRQPIGARVGVLDRARQRLAEHQLHHQERLAAGPEPGVVDGDHARVLQARRQLHLALEADRERGVLRAQHLDRDRAAEPQIAPGEHAAHAAVADLAVEHVAIGGRGARRGARRARARSRPSLSSAVTGVAPAGAGLPFVPLLCGRSLISSPGLRGRATP